MDLKRNDSTRSDYIDEFCTYTNDAEEENACKENTNCAVCHFEQGYEPYRTSLLQQFFARETCNNRSATSDHIFPCHLLKTNFLQSSGQTIDNVPALRCKINKLFTDADLSDVCVQVGCKQFHVHKLILAASSDVFKIMMLSHDWSDHQKKIINLEEEKQCENVFEDFLQYLYSGSITLNHDNVLPLLMLADKYNVTDLQFVCLDYMVSHIVATILNNKAVTWYQYAVYTGHKFLAAVCYNFIKLNFHKVASSPDFYNAERVTILDFLSLSDLVVPDEYSLYLMLSKWMNYNAFGHIESQVIESEDDTSMTNISPEHDHDYLEMISLIRFPMMSLQDLCHLQKNFFANRYSQLFIQRIGLAMKYHSTTLDNRNGSSEFTTDSFLFFPRNYTNESWSTDLSLEHYSSFCDFTSETLAFSSPISGSEADQNCIYEWKMDLYPKGVQFQKGIMVNLWRRFEVSGSTSSVVRMVFRSAEQQNCRVEIAVLVYGVQDQVQYVKKVITRRAFFDEKENVINIDQIVAFNELNSLPSIYLVGKEADTFKLSIVMKPLLAT